MALYGSFRPAMEQVMNTLSDQIKGIEQTGDGRKLYEHLSCRIKDEGSAALKLTGKGLELNERNALRELKDTIGLRIVCRFIDDVYECVQLIHSFPYCSIISEKDYIHAAKPNGYRSYHMVIDAETGLKDVDGNIPGHYYAEIQLRTIAMDTWAALEHELKYKKNIDNQEMIIQELRRCANDLAACDISMQTMRHLIRSL